MICAPDIVQGLCIAKYKRKQRQPACSLTANSISRGSCDPCGLECFIPYCVGFGVRGVCRIPFGREFYSTCGEWFRESVHITWNVIRLNTDEADLGGRTKYFSATTFPAPHPKIPLICERIPPGLTGQPNWDVRRNLYAADRRLEYRYVAGPF